MSSDPEPVKKASVSEAIDELELDLKDFVKKFEHSKQSTIMNPFFGDLNFDEWTQLLHKHAIHHLKQFGVTVI